MTCVHNSIKCGRGEQFSYDGLRVLFEALEEYEDDTGSEVELDVIALCCEYSEDTPEEIAQNYGIDLEDDGNAIKQCPRLLARSHNGLWSY
jgi:hypothetical protein